MTADFSELELYRAFREGMPDEEAASLARLCAVDLPHRAGSDWTPDTFVVLSEHSPAFAIRVAALLAPTFLGAGGDTRRRDRDARLASYRQAKDAARRSDVS